MRWQWPWQPSPLSWGFTRMIASTLEACSKAQGIHRPDQNLPSVLIVYAVVSHHARYRVPN